MPALDRAGDLQARMPSYHVCSSLALPAVPHFLNQEPPRPQQLIFPDFAMAPHLGHAGLVVVIVMAASIYAMWVFVKEVNRKRLTVAVYSHSYIHIIDLELTFAGLHAIGPPVINVFAATSSAALEPSTPRSAATDSA